MHRAGHGRIGQGQTVAVRDRTYMDWNATAPLMAPARDACVTAIDLVGNPSSVHGEGRRLRSLAEGARRDVAADIAVSDEEVASAMRLIYTATHNVPDGAGAAAPSATL